MTNSANGRRWSCRSFRIACSGVGPISLTPREPRAGAISSQSVPPRPAKTCLIVALGLELRGLPFDKNGPHLKPQDFLSSPRRGRQPARGYHFGGFRLEPPCAAMSGRIPAAFDVCDPKRVPVDPLNHSGSSVQPSPSLLKGSISNAD